MKREISKAEEEEARLTAYALGELDAVETEEVEAYLKESAEARASLDDIRSTADLLSAEFLKEPTLSLNEKQVEAITAPKSSGGGKVIRGNFMPVLAVAACASLFAAAGLKQYIGGLEKRGEERLADRAAGSSPAASPEKALPAEGAVDRASPNRAMETEKLDEAVVASATPKRESSASSGITAVKPGELKSRSIASAELAAGPGEDASKEPAARFGNLKPSDRAVGIADEMAPKMVKEKPGSKVAAKPKPAPSLGAAAPPVSPAKKKSESKSATRGSDTKSEGLPSRRKEFRRRALPSLDALAGGGVAGEAERDADPLAEKRSEDKAKRLPKEGDDGGVKLDGESYGQLVDNPWVSTWKDGLSTFAIDVDTGTYPNVRRLLKRRAALPPKDAVRVEEMINYFSYDYPEPEGDAPFSVNMEVASCPWAKDHRLLRVGLKGRAVNVDKRPPSNLIFLIDVSGSMGGADKIDLLKTSMMAMVGQLNEDDRIGIVTYAGNSGIALAPSHGDLKDKINAALKKLQTGGSTNGAAGITTAYSLAKANFVEGGTNRVILATDGDFNVGIRDNNDLIQLVEKQAGDKIFLTVLGFGEGNLQDHRMEQIADKGNGSYHYIDSEKEGEKVLVRGLGATLVTVAKDVKVQMDFNPAKVSKYRLIGYANRMLPDEAINNHTADAGEIGAGHTVTALYEIVPTPDGAVVGESAETGSRFRERGALVKSPLLLALNLNYKLPEAPKEDEGEDPIVVPLVDPGKKWPEASEDFRFAAAVAGFGMLLRDSDYLGMLNYDLVLELGGEGIPEDGDKFGLRAEFMDLVKAAKSLSVTKE